ncbi:damage-inducible protein J [Pantoea sp. EA-12]|uniref:damage-inducible protein J n=1 Tax=Pantoea sp. EA-12 TaxID=3043303 RepID=UPI0024B4D5A7|nr:damage-inducible protein J [Pantoea sp. EA-12]MDI9221399.1 damage-inducible protein J [Pantoea sp. EA-12]
MSSTLHFRIDDETKRLAMQAAEEVKFSLTELMRQRVVELADGDRRYQSHEHDICLERQITQAFERHDSDHGEYISHEEVTSHMDKLRERAQNGKL